MSRTHKHLRAGIGAGAIIIAMASAPSASAADAEPSASAAPNHAATPQDAPAKIADIVVTAERRSSSVQKTPITITAISGDSLQRNQSINIESFADNIPNVTFGKNTGSAKIFIRGVGLDAITPGSDPRVAIYTDGVYEPRSQAAFVGLFDLDRIEVLAGPQGTLYGRNATAGAINFISRAPGDTLNGYGTVDLGNYNAIRVEGAVGGPISDTIRARFSFQKIRRDGYGKMIDTGLGIDDADSFAMRGKIAFEPSSTFNLTLEGDYYNSNDNSNGLHVLALTPSHVPTPTNWGYTYATNPRDLAGTRPESHIKSYGISATANLDLGSIGRLTSITAWRHFIQNALYDADQTTFDGVPAYTREDSTSWSQELHLSGKVGRVDYLIGGYYFTESLFAGIDPTIRGQLVDAIFGGNGNGAAYTAVTGLPLQPLAYYRGPNYGGNEPVHAFAFFTQETIHINDKLGLDVGLRYSHESRRDSEYTEFDPIFTGPAIPNPPFATIPAFTTTLQQAVVYTSTDPKVTLHYQFTPTTMAYLTFSQGFKSGGFNAGFLQAPFAPEKLRSYEGGVKTDLFDHRFRANVSAFYYTYSNLQVNITEGISLITRNAASATLYGLEGQFTAAPVDNLKINLNASYLHSKYNNYITPNPLFPGQGTPGVTLNGQPAFQLAGNQLAYAPKYKLDGEIAYTIHSGALDFTPRANVSWTSRTFFSQFDEPWTEQHAYTKVDLFLDVEDKALNLAVTAYVHNVGNTVYKTSGTVSSNFLGFQVVGALGAPRTYGVSVTKRF